MADLAALDKVYDPQAVEPDIYRRWEQSAAFTSKPDDRPHDRTFTVVIPPPNVTGALHLGHALNNTLQDILVRYHRMRGFNTLWQPGTDHAGIATQAVVERRLRETEGKTRHELGREELVKRIWHWKDQYESRILSQLKLMGCSCDWSRNRFTLDEGLARAVRHMFFMLFGDGLIFRGQRLVNWDTQLQTAVADDEVYYDTVKGHFWHFKYPVIRHEGTEARRHEADLPPSQGGMQERSHEPEFVTIATTRPETMLGDTAVAVHPDPEGFFNKAEAELKGLWDQLSSRTSKEAADVKDRLDALTERRKAYLPLLIQLRDMAQAGRKIMLPLVERPIPLICDDWADPTLGTGCVKITPAHDPNDYEVGVRHNLPMINVLTADGNVARIIESDGTVNPNSERYEGLAFASEGRERVVADMEARGLLGNVEDRAIEIGHSDRSKLPIEPFLSDQWFVKTGDAADPGTEVRGSLGLAQAAMDAIASGRIQVFPPRYAKSYLDWLAEKRDWCISRQLWWGHRVPVWRREFHPFTFGSGERSPTNVLRDLTTPFCQAPWSRTIGDRPEEGSEHYVSFREVPTDEEIEALLAAGFQEEEDVLDTWFSSALWPFSTLGWPEKTPHLRQYYPTAVLCTSRDIITNWVARMVMFGLYAMGEVPFDHVYIHPKILDGRGETMSKSKGNGVDPVDVIHTHGADALRYAMADMCTETQDIRMPVEYVCPHCGQLTDQSTALAAEEKRQKSRGQRLERPLQPADIARVKCKNKQCGREFATQWAEQTVKEELGVGRETSDKFDVGRNFCNKLWNAARFAFMNLEGTTSGALEVTSLPPEDRWILARLSQTIRNFHTHLSAYHFAASVKELRDFFWECLCDWYIELTKPRMTIDPDRDSDPDSPSSAGTIAPKSAAIPITNPAKQILAFCLDQVLRLWHPTIPFITECLWQQLNGITPKRGLPPFAELKTDTDLILAPFPPFEGYPALEDETMVAAFTNLQEATRGVRDLRSRCGVSPKQRPAVTVVVSPENVATFEQYAHILRHMARIGALNISTDAKRPRNAGSTTVRGLRIYVHDVSDDDAERTRMQKAIEGLEKQIQGKEAKLANEKFVVNAKPEVVELERTRLAELIAERDSLAAHLSELGG